MSDDFEVVASAGSLASGDSATARFAHRWTPGGVSVTCDFTGAHLLHLSIAGCVLNDLYREAEPLDIRLDGVRVTAVGGFDTTTWASTGVTYRVDLDTRSDQEAVRRLLSRVDEVAEIPRVVRQGVSVDSAARPAPH